VSKIIDGLNTRRVVLTPGEETIFDFGYNLHSADIALLGDVTGPVYILENATVAKDNAKAIKLDSYVKAYELRSLASFKELHIISDFAVEIQIVARWQ
jgi:phage FluMu protein gp41